MKKWRLSLRLFPLFAIALLLSGCGKEGLSTLIPMGTVAKEQADLMLFSLLIMVLVMVVVIVLFTYAIIKFRKKRGQEDFIPKQVEGNAKLELLWTIIPIILLIILAVPTISKTFAHSDTHVAKGDDVIKVKVTGHQYWWEFEYPDQKIKTAQDLVIPTGKKVVVELTSKDVIHAFWVPALAGKIDANPGQTTSLWLDADKEGTYKGRCAELCGSSHALMYFNVKAVSPDEFKQWSKDMKDGPSAPTTASAKKGEQIFKNNCMSCHAVGEKGGQTAPNLSNFADRENIAGFKEHNKKNLKAWIKNPGKIKPGAEMPSFEDELSDDQINALADYLFSLSVKK
ncbi:cytochrome c oxidase subunit 2 [Scopulibacillus darangshiensis]|uniref:Cytochrome c oxidase subunit 2 n=1 Tax=Scopulibacillus darangshiensis TaxID=442528 RepID=A0A4R2P8X0_9BACL|nr:cytochrome c oxidase subunit II [Scopulibacillus darangshiensis]TCP30501.1 cytochrome c oxidase subunit 2 [Scopulibacillus darangshiensis]